MREKIDIYLIRHTKPLIEPGTCYGQTDCSVADDYSVKLLNIINYFEEIKIDAIYSSPLKRCAVLAEDLAKTQLNHPVIYDDRFKEINFGNWEGQKWDDIAREDIDNWNENRLSFRFPGGESPEIFHDRVLQASFDVLGIGKEKIAYKSIVLVAHSGVICSLLCRHLKLPLENMTELSVDYASISKITI